MSSVSDEKAIITIEVDLVSKVTGDPSTGPGESGFFSDLPEDIKPFIEQAVQDATDEAIEDALDEAGVDSDTIDRMKNLTSDIDSKGISNVKNLAKNPEGFMENTFMRVLSRAGPYGALAAAIIAAIAGAPDMIKAVVEALGMKGGPLNQDYAFTEEEQYGQAFSRLVQFRRVTGDDPIITVTTKGFVAGDADFNDNSLVDVETGRMGRVDLNQSSLGYVHGV
jgi:hypothetical protein